MDNGTALLSSGVWKQVQGGDTGKVRFVPNPKNNNRFVYSTNFQGLFRSDNYGKESSWNQVSLQQDEFPAGMVGFEVDPFGSGRVLMVGQQHTFEMFDDGANWQVIGPALSGEKTNSVASLAFSSDPNVIYIAYQNGMVFKTTNGGGDGTAANWSDISDGTGWGGTITGMAVSPSDSDTIYLTSRSKVWFRTLDAGKRKWIDITGNLPSIVIRNIVIAGPSYILIGTEVGVYVSIDQKQRWMRYGDGLPDAPILDLQYNGSDLVAAGTYGRGVFVAKVEPPDVPKAQITSGPSHDWKECDPGPIVGEKRTFKVTWSGLLEPTTFQWTVAGAEPAKVKVWGGKYGWVLEPDPGNGSTFHVDCTAPGTVTVTVTVTDVNGCTVSRKVTFWVSSPELAQVVHWVCLLEHELKKIIRVPPWNIGFTLPDPAPLDLVTRALSGPELREIQLAARRIIEITNKLSELTSRERQD